MRDFSVFPYHFVSRLLLGFWLLAALCIGIVSSGSAIAQSPPGPDYHLNGPGLAPDGDVSNPVISPDGKYTVYLEDRDLDNVSELYSVPIGGGNPVKLNGPLVGGGDVLSRFSISPNSQRVVYLADQDTNDVIELYSAPIDGTSAAVKLNGSLVAGGNVSYGFIRPDINSFPGYAISPNSQRVVYWADQDTDRISEIYSAPIDGTSAAVKLNGNIVAGGDVLSRFSISPNSQRVVYRADQDTDEVFELYSAPIDGTSAAVKLNSSLVAGGNVSYGFIHPDFNPFPGYAISPNSQRVVYLADQDTDGVEEIYSAPIDGTNAAVKLNGNLVAGGGVFFNFAISPNSQRAVYLADQDTDEVFELYSAPIDGSIAAVKLNGNLVAAGNVSNFEISPNSQRAVYRADQDTDRVFELYSVPIDGNIAAVKLNGSIVAGSVQGVNDLTAFRISPNSQRVVYRANQDTGLAIELYSAPIDGSFSAVKLNDSVAPGRDVSSNFAISPNSQRVVYLAEQVTHNDFELYSAPINRAGDAIRLNGSAVAEGDAFFIFEISPNSRRVIYQADQINDRVEDLFTVTIDTGCPATGFSLSRTICRSNGTGLDILDNTPVSQSVTVSAPDQTVKTVVLDLIGLRHASIRDLVFELIAPDGTTMTVFDRPEPGGVGPTDLRGDYRFIDGGEDLANPPNLSPALSDPLMPVFDYAPDQTQGIADTFGGVPASGQWQLRINDLASGDEGELQSWRLILILEDNDSFYVIPTPNGGAAVIPL